MSLENSAASAFRASLSSYRVNSSAFNPKAGLPDFASTTVTETRLAAPAGKAHSSAAIQNLILNFDLHPRVEPRNLGRCHFLSVLDALHDFGIGSETVADLDLPGFDRISMDNIDLIYAEHVIDGKRGYQPDRPACRCGCAPWRRSQASTAHRDSRSTLPR